MIGIVRGTGGGRSLMLNAHMDTVGHGGMPDPLAGTIADGKVSGRGAWDMKGSLAAIMLAARDLAADPPAGDVIVTAVVDEEYASIGTSAIVEQYTADGAIVTEPTQLELSVAHKGFIWFDITTKGVAAHGSQPALGVDAIAKMGKVLVGSGRAGGSIASGRAASIARHRLDPCLTDSRRHRAFQLSRHLHALDRAAPDPR